MVWDLLWLSRCFPAGGWEPPCLCLCVTMGGELERGKEGEIEREKVGGREGGRERGRKRKSE